MRAREGGMTRDAGKRRSLNPGITYGEGAVLAEGAETTLILKVTAPFPCGPSYCTLAAQSPAISGLMLARYWPAVAVRSMAAVLCITMPGMFMSRSNLTVP